MDIFDGLTMLGGLCLFLFGMETMTGAVSGLSEVPAFRDLFLMFKHPLLGLLAGAVLTAVIQSNSASVGILQALAMTGVVSYGAAIPIVMGDAIGSYLIKVSAKQLGVEESEEITALLKSIGDFERISDHAVNILESAEELQGKKLSLSEEAHRELSIITAAVSETLALAGDAFIRSDVKTAAAVEPLEQVVDDLKERLRTHHILRMKEGKCTAEAGFVWSDLLTNLERVSDHCSNIAGCVIDRQHLNLNLHESLNAYRKSSEEYEEKYRHYQNKYFVG